MCKAYYDNNSYDGPDIVVAEVDQLEGLESVESVAGEILHQVIAQVQIPDHRNTC